MIKFVYQNKPLGTGDAVLKTKKFITDDFFLMLLPDDLIIKKNCSKSMINIHNRYKIICNGKYECFKKNCLKMGNL